MLARLRERPLRANVRVEPKDFLRLDTSIRKLACKVRGQSYSLRERWSADDLIQEIYLRALISVEKFSGKSSLRTWTLSVAHNHLRDLAREASRRRTYSLGDDLHPADRRNGEPWRRMELRSEIKGLLGWLRENPEEIDFGWEVFNLLLKTHGDHSYVALAMSLHTQSSWTLHSIRMKVREISRTDKGKTLCSSL